MKDKIVTIKFEGVKNNKRYTLSKKIGLEKLDSIRIRSLLNIEIAELQLAFENL